MFSPMFQTEVLLSSARPIDIRLRRKKPACAGFRPLPGSDTQGSWLKSSSGWTKSGGRVKYWSGATVSLKKPSLRR